MMRPNVAGAVACVAGQAAFGVNDALIKLVMARLSEPVAVVLRGVMVVPLLVLIVLVQFRVLARARRSPTPGADSALSRRAVAV